MSGNDFSDFLNQQGGNGAATGFRVLWNNAQPIIRSEGGRIFGSVAEMAARPFLGDDPETAEKNAATVRDVAKTTYSYGVAVAANVRDFTGVAKRSSRSFGDLVEQVRPFLVAEFGKSSKGKLLRSHNEVIVTKRGRVMEETRYGLYGASVNLLDKVPDALTYMGQLHDEAKARGDESGASLEDVKDAVLSVKDSDAPGSLKDRVDGAIEQSVGSLASSDLFDESGRTMLDLVIRTGVPVISKQVASKGQHAPCAYDMILDLAQSSVGRFSGKEILDIFAQHQEDIGGATINERTRGLQDLEDACEIIAQELNGGLDPMALVSLVGERKVLSPKLGVASPEEVRESLRQVTRALERVEQVDVDEFLTGSVFGTKDDFKAVLGSLKGEDRTFFAALFPDDVLKEAGGLKTKEIEQLKEDGSKHFEVQLLEVVADIAAAPVEQLQEWGMTAREAQQVQALGNQIDLLGAAEFAGELTGDAKQGVVEAVRNARGYWEERVSQGGVRRGSTPSSPAEEEGIRGLDALLKRGEKDSFASRVDGDSLGENSRER